MDKRSNNGGHSTKSKGIDKRKNDYRQAIENAVSREDVELILNQCKDIAMSSKPDRMQAVKLILEYTLGKPKQELDLNNNMNITSDSIKELFKIDSSK
jgi:hypothetical protein